MTVEHFTRLLEYALLIHQIVAFALHKDYPARS